MAWYDYAIEALPVVGNMYSSYMASRTAKKNTEMTIQANKDLAEYGYTKDLEMWNRVNQYNTPEAQQARLKNAGLNPNLVYGTGTVTGNTTPATMPRYQAPRVEYNYKPFDVAPAIQSYYDIKMKNAQIDNLKELTKVNQAKAINEVLKKGGYLGKSNKALMEAGMMKLLMPDIISAKRFELQMPEQKLQNLKMQGKLYAKDLTIKEQIYQYKKLENAVKEIELDWMKNGKLTKDSAWMRMLIDTMNEFGLMPGDLFGDTLPGLNQEITSWFYQKNMDYQKRKKTVRQGDRPGGGGW